MKGTMPNEAKVAGKKAILQMLELGMPIVDNTEPLDFRLSVACIMGGITAVKKTSGTSNAFDFIMGYLSVATDEEITEIMRESKARSN